MPIEKVCCCDPTEIALQSAFDGLCLQVGRDLTIDDIGISEHPKYGIILSAEMGDDPVAYIKKKYNIKDSD